MKKQEIIDSLEICISMAKVSENTFLVRKLEEIEMALIKEWNESDAYYEQIKQSINEWVSVNKNTFEIRGIR